jgi:multisubunit Na+/H+ antiporter MnhB subunit
VLGRPLWLPRAPGSPVQAEMSAREPVGRTLLSSGFMLVAYVVLQAAIARFIRPGAAFDSLAQGTVLFITAILITEKAVATTAERWKFLVGAASFLVLVPLLFIVGFFLECFCRPGGCDV